ncbi:alginate lyase family protein [Zobellia roscoffensis]|uniref:alginate lyase family protein n=1 Tax=Zobellia roscoffensis TaxID=2779508 RepID=UPI001D050ECB|nr:alginate lyase family protein [Zobellia roscoffensis]
MMKKVFFILITMLCGLLHLGSITINTSNSVEENVIRSIGHMEVARAKAFLTSVPVTVTDAFCKRSAGSVHDFYSEGDYWWPDPNSPEGPYIQKDGQTNPDNFVAHRLAMIRLSEIVGTLTSAWLLTEEKVYVDKALEHLNAWFVEDDTMMNPHMLYAQAIYGKVTGRGIGLIDAYHFVEVAQSIKVLSKKGAIPDNQAKKLKNWFGRFLKWMTEHEYGISEMNWKNNHGTCWAVTAASLATLTENERIIELCTNRFKEILLPEQMAKNGSFPLELVRTKPFGYSLFNIDAFCTLAQILSTQDDNLFEYSTPNGKSLKQGIEFIYPFIADKSKWPFEQDIYIWNEWPVRHPSLLFTAMAFDKQEYIDTYLKLPEYPLHSEVIRNLPVRHPIIWFFD